MKNKSEERRERIDVIKNNHGWDIPYRALECKEWIAVNNHIFARVCGHIVESDRILRYKELPDGSYLARDYGGQFYYLKVTSPRVVQELQDMLDDLRGENYPLDEIIAEEHAPSFLEKYFPWLRSDK